MESLPSVWGSHAVAHIDPIVVRDKLITSIFDAPDEWVSRLETLGFRKASQSWLRLGSLTPAEYQYLSPSINLVGLRLEDVIDLPAEDGQASPVPYDVKDGLLRLWQRQPASVLVALSMEHDSNYTRSEAWGFVEAALEGEVTPETETLFGLTFTKMERDAAMSPAARAYADELGWSGRSQAPRHRGSVLLAKGGSVAWADRDGVVHQGRVGQKVLESDTGCWVYKSAPVWVGDYVMTTPLWVRRDQLQFTGWSPDWLEADLSRPAEPIAAGATVTDGLVHLAPFERSLLQQLIATSKVFPAWNWRECYEAFKGDPGMLETEPASIDDFMRAGETLERVQETLYSLSELYYRDEPIQFALTSATGNLALSVVVNAGLGVEPSLPLALPLSGDGADGAVSLAALAQRLETMRSAKERQLVSDSTEVSASLGLTGSVLPVQMFRSASMSIWPRIAAHCKQSVPEALIFKLSSIVLSDADYKAFAIRRSPVHDLSEALSARLQRVASQGAGAYEVRLAKYDCGFVEATEVAALLEAGGTAANWHSDLTMHPYTLYEAQLRTTGQPWSDHALLPDASIYHNDRALRLSVTDDLNKASAAYASTLSQLEPLVDDAGHDKLKELGRALKMLPLAARMKEALVKLARLPRVTVENYVKSEIARQLKGRTADWDDHFQDRIMMRVVDEILSPGAQGVVVLATTTGRSIRVRTTPVRFRDAAATQSRAAELLGAAEDYKSRYRLRGTIAVVDGISLADPDLCAVLNGDVLAERSPAASEAETSSKGRQAPADGYEDAGVVAGFALKDLRQWDRPTLLRRAEGMTDQQKQKYLTKEVLWPRQSFEAMRDNGVPLRQAFVFDMFWRSLPKHPKSPNAEHVRVFINVLAQMRDAVLPILKEEEATQSGPSHSARSSDEQFEAFCLALRRATVSVCEDLDGFSAVYRSRECKVRGYGLWWNDFNVAPSYKLSAVLTALSWSDVLKEKKSVKAAASGSRVAKDEVVREGKDHRNGVSVTGEDFIKTFGFSGVEYGNWTNQTEREKHLNFAFDSMMDFADRMGWEPMTLSLGGRLGLCIGSRGRGGANPATAHFEPANMAINLTRMRGDGSLAHEYFHAVASHYGRLASGGQNDLANLFGYALQRQGTVPSAPPSGLRDEMRTAFFNLMVAIIRAPEPGTDWKDTANYKEWSPMMTASREKDGSREYWSTPAEMFARSMEVWFKDQLSARGERNDYLVRANKDASSSALYPDAEHLKRINHFVSPWLESVMQTTAQVDHPFLGAIEMPILHTEHRSLVPLTPWDLQNLANDELLRLFGAYAPSTQLIGEPSRRAGWYDVARDIIGLNQACADSGTFYHEAWHACEAKLLTQREKIGLADVFASSSPVSRVVLESMAREGFSEAAMAQAERCATEMQAYAFQLWVDGKFDFTDELVSTFYKTRGFVDGVLDVASMFGPEDAERLFRRFMDAELVTRQAQVEEYQQARETLDAAPDLDAWDEDNTLYWPVNDAATGAASRLRGPGL